MINRVTSTIDRVDSAAQVVPITDFMNRLVAYNQLENVRWCRPIYPAQHEKPPVEPRGQQMGNVAVQRAQFLVTLHEAEEIGAHRDQIAGAPRRPVQSSDQFLAARLRGKMQLTGVFVAGLRAPAFNCLGELFPVWTEVTRQGFEQ